MLVRHLLVVAALALAAAPAGASASPFGFPFDPLEGTPPQLRAELPDAAGVVHSPAPVRSVFVLEPRHGYQIGVVGIGSAVILEVVHKYGRHGRALTAYIARGTVTPSRLGASFGKMGSVAMRFQPSTDRSGEKPRRHCKGADRFVNRRGLYVGNVRFRGEGGYVTVHAHRTKGLVSTVAPRCWRAAAGRRALATRPSHAWHRGIRPSQGRHREFDLLGASWRHGVTATTVLAASLSGKSFFLAATEQSQGRLAILRFALAREKLPAFAIDDALTWAVITPPAPFHGTGTYQAAPDGAKTWSGGLTVNLPGAPRVPLTGLEFKALLKAGL
jgi:hypothetical protein